MALKEYPLALIPLPGGLPTPTPWRNIAGPEQSCPVAFFDMRVLALMQFGNAGTWRGNCSQTALNVKVPVRSTGTSAADSADDEWIANYTYGGFFDLFRLRTKTDRPRLGRFSFFGISGCHCLA